MAMPPASMRDSAPARAASPLTRRGFLAPRRQRVVDPDRYWVRVHRRAMACRFEIMFDVAEAHFVSAAQSALNQIDEIESRLTVFRDSSAIVDLNRRAAREAVDVDALLFTLLAHCKTLSIATDGAFDITSTPLSRCWGFLRREGRLPSPSEIESARADVGVRHMVLDPARSSVHFAQPGLELNLGAIGKGYALDCVASTLRRAGVNHALLSAGRSSLLALSGRQPWSVDIVSPRCDKPLARVWLRDVALGTSGAGEQFVVVGGQRHGHVLDPRTGWPAEGVLSASVLTGSAADADALSTAFLVGGPELARRYCDRHPDVLALITPDDGSGRTFVIGDHPGAEVEEV